MDLSNPRRYNNCNLNDAPLPELTLSHLCGKDPRVSEYSRDGDDGRVGVGADGGGDRVVMDFMSLNGASDSSDPRRWDRSSKRVAASESEGVDDTDFQKGGAAGEKRPKIEGLNLSLALPQVAMTSIPVSNPHGNGSLVPFSSLRTTTTCSNDFIAASMSMSYSFTHSRPFSHNPSCSLTCNSTENYDCSVGNKGRDDQIWYAGEGTNGSVHSRFKPLGDGGAVALANACGSIGGNGNSLNLPAQGSQQISRGCSSSFYQSMGSERYSYLPSELPARPTRDAISGGSRGEDFENSRDLDSFTDVKARRPSMPERLVREIVSESIPVMSQILQELSKEVLESIKDYLRSLLDAPERAEELSGLQRKLEKRSDLTKETLSKCNKDQLQILVALRTRIGNFLSGKCKISSTELVEVFLFLRCMNVNCMMLLPVDDCECKVCSTNRGFCSSCTCPVCLTFDCASNTCSWVGCDLCSHWCHTSCSIQKNLIRPIPSAKPGAAEVHFYCMGCDHASEMYGFVKDVFSHCSKDWGPETLMKELDCVRKIFSRSEDSKGKELYKTADELLSRLGIKSISPSDANDTIIKLFNGVDRTQGFPDHLISSDTTPVRPSPSGDPSHRPVPSYARPPIPPRESQDETRKKEIKASRSEDKDPEDDLMALMRKNGFDSMESVIRIKAAEARMFQSKADDARKEAVVLERMIRAEIEKLEEEYVQKLSGIRLQEADDRRRKKLEELKLLEDSHRDYLKMKARMQSEIGGLHQRMEATRKRWWT
ncbi:hypothetical protein MLD38_017569 [Melastoma candidum]|uniref:Uncharacterized protein n=1 Tax=Melastoma candidum TaxID=119954 RepID=A0ACB9QRK2_9MYRT|nr:hypothetical protein MLD38_017569 [Melastoma candidum]